MARMKQFDIRFVGRAQGTLGSTHRLRATRNTEDPESALLALYDEYEDISHVVVTDVETGQTSRPSLVECRQVQVCAACCADASERAVDDTPLCSDCAKALAQIRPDDPVTCAACGGSVNADAQIAWICRKSGGGAYCDRCSFAMNKRTST
jgi:hypothetical protein